jgi:UDP-N-acetylmuramoyl-tripeptide--D-alanyl-D-alanine ligase
MHAAMRMQVIELDDLTLINDAYNASPDSMAAALATLAHLTQERGGESWAFLGIMRELGESTTSSHREIGTLCSDLRIDHLIAVNAPEYAAGVAAGSETAVNLCSSREEAKAFFSHFNRGDVILCKGSRSEKMEEIAVEIEKFWTAQLDEEEGGK